LIEDLGGTVLLLILVAQFFFHGKVTVELLGQIMTVSLEDVELT